MTPSDRWTDALKRAKVEAAIKTPNDEEASPKKKWWNAKNIITALQQRDESDISLSENGDDDSDDGSDAVERKHRQKLLEKVKKGKRNAKMMESPVPPKTNVC